MYNNHIQLPRFFALFIMLLSIAFVLLWLIVVEDDGLTLNLAAVLLLAFGLGLFTSSVLLLCRIRWVRLPLSAVFHFLILSILVGLIRAVSTIEGALQAVALIVASMLGIALLFLGILALHSESMKLYLGAIKPSGDLQGNVPEKKRWSNRIEYLLLLLAVAGLIVLVIICLPIVSMILAKPTIKVDYLSECNRLTKPVDYDPNNNAAPYYEKLFSEFKPLPEEVQFSLDVWPTELSAEQFAAIENWVSVNETVLEILSEAARRPYCWFELRSQDGVLSRIEVPYLDEIRSCSFGIILAAKYKASQGDINEAFQLLADLHMMGVSYNHGGTLVEQLVGLAVCEKSCQTLLDILYYCDVEVGALKYALNTLATRIPQIETPRFSIVEELHGYDCVQRWFTDDGCGNGKLIPRALREHQSQYRVGKDGVIYTNKDMSYLDALWIALNHPDRDETTLLYERFNEVAKNLAKKTPWELHEISTSYDEELNELVAGNYSLRSMKGSPGSFARVIEMSWRGRVRGEATVTVLAILLYKHDKGRLPDSLEQLVAEGYLANLPMDPYSDGPIVYKVLDDDFRLYSVSKNFRDDGGVHTRWDMAEDFGDYVFWPVESEDEMSITKR